jgi:hypothetical protein
VCEQIFIDTMSEHLVLHRKFSLIFVDHTSVIVMWALSELFRCFLTHHILSFYGMTTVMSAGMGGQVLGQLVLICLMRYIAEETNVSGSKLGGLLHVLPRIRKLAGCYKC